MLLHTEHLHLPGFSVCGRTLETWVETRPGLCHQTLSLRLNVSAQMPGGLEQEVVSLGSRAFL